MTPVSLILKLKIEWRLVFIYSGLPVYRVFKTQACHLLVLCISVHLYSYRPSALLVSAFVLSDAHCDSHEKPECLELLSKCGNHSDVSMFFFSHFIIYIAHTYIFFLMYCLYFQSVAFLLSLTGC